MKYVEDLIDITSSHVNLIQKNPLLCKQTEIQNVYESAMGHFSIFYTIKDRDIIIIIIIIAFWYNRQDPKKLLKQLTKK